MPLLPAVGEEAAATAAGAPLLCPVGPDGNFLGGSGSEPFRGLDALKDGEQRVLQLLRERNTLLLTVSLGPERAEAPPEEPVGALRLGNQLSTV